MWTPEHHTHMSFSEHFISKLWVLTGSLSSYFNNLRRLGTCCGNDVEHGCGNLHAFRHKSLGEVRHRYATMGTDWSSNSSQNKWGSGLDSSLYKPVRVFFDKLSKPFLYGPHFV